MFFMSKMPFYFQKPKAMNGQEEKFTLQCNWNTRKTMSSRTTISACFLVRATHCKDIGNKLSCNLGWVLIFRADFLLLFPLSLVGHLYSIPWEAITYVLNKYLRSFPPVIDRNYGMHLRIVTAFFCIGKTSAINKSEGDGNSVMKTFNKQTNIELKNNRWTIKHKPLTYPQNLLRRTLYTCKCSWSCTKVCT